MASFATVLSILGLALGLYLFRKINMLQDDFAHELEALDEQLGKVSTEILNEITSLEAAVKNAGATSAQIDDAFGRLKAKVNALDLLNDDVPAAPAPSPTPAPSPAPEGSPVTDGPVDAPAADTPAA